MTYSAVNTIWVLIGAALVFFMQAGFSIDSWRLQSHFAGGGSVMGICNLPDC